jgi:hypothetical protein
LFSYINIINTLFIIFLNLLPQALFANEVWYHIPLKSQDGTPISVDYQFINGSYEPHHQQLYHFIDKLWINVFPNQIGILSENDNINAVFSIYRNQVKPNTSESWVLDTTLSVSLYWNGKNFTGQLKGIDQFGYYTTKFPIYSVGAFGEYEYRQEIIFNVNKIDGQFPLIDPINKSPNFKVDLYKRVLEQGMQ